MQANIFIKRFILSVASMMAVLLAGCGGSSTMSIVLNVDTGDSISVSLDTSDGNKMEFDKEKNIINIRDAEAEGEPITARSIFVPQESYALYYETAYSDTRCIIIDEGESNGIAYTFYSYNDGNRVNYECIGWVTGTNTGVVMESTVLGEEESKLLFGKLSFEAKETGQQNEGYIYEPIVENENSISETGVESTGNGNTEDAGMDDGESGDRRGEYGDGADGMGSHAADWTSLEIKIDGTPYKFPYSYELLRTNGWEFNAEDYLGEDDEYLLEEGEYTYSTTKLQNEKYGKDEESACLYVGFKNYSKETKDVLDCDIWAIEVSCVYGNEEIRNRPEVELPGGIKLGASYDEIINAYGEPTEEFRKDNYIQMDYDNDYNQHMTLFVYYGGDSDIQGLMDAEFRKYQ